MAEATIFLQLEPVWSRWVASDGRQTVRSMRITKMFQNRPQKISGVVVELKLRLPDAAFMPLAPVVTIDIPESALDYEPEITVVLPEGGGQDG